jgi:alpha-L-rhamnosidase
MRTRFACCLALSLVLPFLTWAQQPSLRPWAAQWITAPDVPERDEAVLQFRKIVPIAEKPQHFIIHVSADNQFVLYVNQRRVGSGPSRSDLHHWRYETYDIADFLHSGSNVLAAIVWNFGTHAAIAQFSDRIGFLVHGAGEKERVADTNIAWEVAREKGVATFKPKVPGYYAAEPGERLDGKVFDWDWQDPLKSKGKWVHPISLGRGALREETDAPNNWQLEADPLPPMEHTEIKDGRLVRAVGVQAPSGFPAKGFTVPAHAKASVLIDYGHLTTAYPSLGVAGGLKAKMRLTYAEALLDNNGQKGNRNQIEGKHIVGTTDEFASGGQSGVEFTPLGWRTWRYLQLDIETGEQPITIRQLRAFFTAYPFEERARLELDDALVHRIWQVGWRTARLDAHDTYMDTPYWERLQYVGDTRIQALISYTVAGDDRLGRQAINAYNYSRIPEGLTQSRYPSSLTQIIPTFSLLWIGMVHDFWMYRDDPEFVRSQLQGTRAVLDWYLKRQRPDGLLGNIPWWPFVDWGKDFDFGRPPQDEDGGSSIITLQFIEALRYSAEIETALGDSYHADRYREAAERAARGTYARCWNRQYGLLADTPAQKHFSQHANILGIWLDLIPTREQRDVLTKILSASDPQAASGSAGSTSLPSMTTATYYFRFYLARAVEHAGMGDQYLNLLGPWEQMLKLGLSTWAESPEPTRSDSHAWSAHPNYDLLTIVAGIRPSSAGFRSVVIEPHLGDLKHLRAMMPTTNGEVRVEYTRGEKGVEAKIDLPQGMTGKMSLGGQETSLHAGEQQLMLP